jgi:very-short-patch-repair endonuclease
MGKKLTNAIIDERLKNRTLKRVGNYQPCDIPISFQCITCNHIWNAIPNNVLRGSNCPKCSNKLPLNNNIVDERLQNRTVKRVGDIINSTTPIYFSCLIDGCGYVWLTPPSCVLHGTNCPKCANYLPLTNEIVDERLQNKNIKRIGNYINSYTPVQLICLVKNCNHVWSSIIHNIFNNHGCPKCAGLLPLTNEMVDKRLGDRKIKRLDNIINSCIHIQWLCLEPECNYIWKAASNSILSSNSGCPKCSKKLDLTNEEVDKRFSNTNLIRLDDITDKSLKRKIRFKCLKCNFIFLKDFTTFSNPSSACASCARNLKLTNKDIDKKLIGRNILRLDNYISSNIPINFQCLICNNIWKTSPSCIISKTKTGCPFCCLGKNENIVLSFLKLANINFEHQKNIKNISLNANRKLLIDFYLFDKKIAIEYNGRQHYQPVKFGGIAEERAQQNFIKQQARDKYLQDFCDLNNIKLIWIDGREYINEDLEKYLTNVIIPQLL